MYGWGRNEAFSSYLAPAGGFVSISSLTRMTALAGTPVTGGVMGVNFSNNCKVFSLRKADCIGAWDWFFLPVISIWKPTEANSSFTAGR